MGQVSNTTTPVDELVGLLSKFAPESLVSLRNKYPSEGELLRPGLRAGGETRDDTVVRAEVCMAGLAAAIKVSKDAQDAVASRLKRSRGIQLAGQTLTIVGGASFFGVLALDAPGPAKYAAAVVNLFGSVLTFLAQHLQSAPLSKGRLLSDMVPDLIANRFKAESLLRELEIVQRIGGDKGTSEMIKSGNILAMNISTVATQLAL